jgi:hypothetical protein
MRRYIEILIEEKVYNRLLELCEIMELDLDELIGSLAKEFIDKNKEIYE